MLLGSTSLAIGAAMAGHVLGGVMENPPADNCVESDGLGRFVVDDHNKREPQNTSPTPWRSCASLHLGGIGAANRSSAATATAQASMCPHSRVARHAQDGRLHEDSQECPAPSTARRCERWLPRTMTSNCAPSHGGVCKDDF